MRVYLDSAPVIYFVEDVPPFANRIQATLMDPNIELIASDLTRLECRVKPIREDKLRLLQRFDKFFGSAIHEIVPLSTEVLDAATDVRVRFGFRTPDAIHIGAALVARCGVLLINDHRLDRAVGIAVQVIEPTRPRS